MILLPLDRNKNAKILARKYRKLFLNQIEGRRHPDFEPKYILFSNPIEGYLLEVI